MAKRILALTAALGLLIVATTPAVARTIPHNAQYRVTNLVSDDTSVHPALSEDPNLVNGWGISALPASPWWVSDNGTNKTTLYNGGGAVQGLVVDVANKPTGTVANATTDFVVTSGADSGPAKFLFATEEGKILGWNPTVPSPATSTTAVVAAAVPGAIFKGLAMARTSGANYLYAADFHGRKIDIFDATFTLRDWGSTAFVDPGIPSNYAPFNVQLLNGWLFVTYAKQDANKEDEIAGRTRGFVSAFAPDGTFITRVASRGGLNAPWGLAWAPSDFGTFGGDLLVGNFGDGRIHAYRLTGLGFRSVGGVRDSHGRVISIDGLWGIGFGNGAASGPTNTLYFAAGPDGETHGVFGTVKLN